MTHNKNTHIF